jgi:hypothetical protein
MNWCEKKHPFSCPGYRQCFKWFIWETILPRNVSYFCFYYLYSVKTFETTSHMRIEISMSKKLHRYAIVDYGRGNFSIS